MSEKNSEENIKKVHRARRSGVKAEKKKLKGKKESTADDSQNASQRNPKAFAINSVQRAERNFRRKEDLTAKKQHIPIVDQTPDEPPPTLVAIVGPPKTGKTTLIKNLIKNFTRTNVTEIKGPITIVTSKKRRITLLECNNDINSLIDVAKCADLVLLLCDASYGFEMEIFEFLNICQVHGMPKIMGVLTHLDMIKNPKQLRKRKKELKHRFWTEVYDGAKLFYLSGLVHGEYLHNEIKNLGRFISVMKFRPLQWRSAHSYILVDRVEDITNSDLVRRNPKCDREVVMYGYVRGVPLKQEHMVHIAGLGDVRIEELNVIPDPCHLPGTEKKRSLLEKERLLYAPMSGVGGIVYDKDAVYIELQGSHSHKEKHVEDSEQNNLVEKIIEKKQTIDEQIEQQEFRLFSDGAAVTSKDFSVPMKYNSSEEELSNDDTESDISEECYNEIAKEDWLDNSDSNDENNERVNFSSESSAEEYQNLNDINEIDGNRNWKQNLLQKAGDAYWRRNSESRSLMRLIYGCYTENKKNGSKINAKQEEASNSEGELAGLFKVAKTQKNLNESKDMRNQEENSFFQNNSSTVRDWLDQNNYEHLRNCFVTGKWKDSKDAENLLQLDEMSEADSEMDGDFEDLEAEENNNGKPNKKLETVADAKDTCLNDEPKQKKMTRIEANNLTRSELITKKLKLKAAFDEEYDNNGSAEVDGRIKGDHGFYDSLKSEAQRQSNLNKSEFTQLDAGLRLQIEGYRAGLYVRLGFKNISSELIEHFEPSYPILIGGLNMAEENIGYVNCKVKKHRWYKKILKTGDPIIISMGWRRFQTVPIYAKIEDNFRHRYLKYTPNHVTCSMTFWGPITPQNTGFLALQSVSHNLEEMKQIGFRIAATGCVTELDKSTQILKKLKLVGYPFKIYKKSAFIKGMFNTTLEVAKYEGAKIKTVSGIRGQIKKAHHTPEGSFRATFEDKILLSDIVFCRTWFRVEVPRFYVSVTSLLLTLEQKLQWQGMKTMGQLKRERAIKNPIQEDSLYTVIKRETKLFKPLVIPKALQRALPYKDKPKNPALDPKNGEMERVAVINSPYEQKVSKLMKMLLTNYRDKKMRDKKVTKLRQRKFYAEKQQSELRKLKRQKELKKKVSRALSKIRTKQKT